jgi:uronate dehydrogenase
VSDHRTRFVLIGGSGAVGSIVAADLLRDGAVIVIDPAPSDIPGVHWSPKHASGIGPDDLEPGDVVVFLATGASDGWSGLLTTDIEGLRNVAIAGRERAIRRMLFASTNRVAFGVESDLTAHGSGGSTGAPDVGLTSTVRPRSEYGVAKAFGEALMRMEAENGSFGVSVLRIGTVRPDDDPEQLVRSPEASAFGLAPDLLRQRLAATWLHHEDLVRIVREEIGARDVFRRRFAFSGRGPAFWPTGIEIWNP